MRVNGGMMGPGTGGEGHPLTLVLHSTVLEPNLQQQRREQDRKKVNDYNVAGKSRRQDKNVTNFVKNVNILEFGYYYLESL